MDGAVTSEPRRSGRRREARAYAAARRHSRYVRFLRRAIPFGAAVAIGLVALVAIFDPFGRMAAIDIGPVRLSGTKIQMDRPRLTGYRKDNRGYEVTATAAFQDVRKPTIVELKEMRGRIALDDSGTQAHFEASFGVFDSQKEHLELTENVWVRTDNGQEARLKSASVDFKAGTVVSREPVVVTLPQARIEADALDLSDNGKVISFVGRVRSVFHPVEQNPMQSEAPTGTTPAVASQAAPMSLQPSQTP